MKNKCVFTKNNFDAKLFFQTASPWEEEDDSWVNAVDLPALETASENANQDQNEMGIFLFTEHGNFQKD